MGDNCKNTPTEQHKTCMKLEFYVSMWNRVEEQKLEVVQAKEESTALFILLQPLILGKKLKQGLWYTWQAFSLPVSFERPAAQVNTTFRNLMLLWCKTSKKIPDTFICACPWLLIHWNAQSQCLDWKRQRKPGQAQTDRERCSSYKRTKHMRSEEKATKKAQKGMHFTKSGKIRKDQV